MKPRARRLRRQIEIEARRVLRQEIRHRAAATEGITRRGIVGRLRWLLFGK